MHPSRVTFSSARWSAALLAAVLVGGCDCFGPGFTEVPCETHDDCGYDQHCAADKKCAPGCESDRQCVRDEPDAPKEFCNLANRTVDPRLPEAPAAAHCSVDTFECEEQGACCPGQVCAQGVLCIDKFTSCTKDEECTVRGQTCRHLSEQVPDEGCAFERCGPGGTCAEGLDCFNGWCVGEPPCNRSCPSGSVCTPVNNLCFELGTDHGYPASCSQSCAPGTLLVFSDGANVFNRCARSGHACECAPLPPVRARDTARHSTMAATPDALLVSAYDTDHGDLVVHAFDKVTLARSATTWVDGVPSSGTIVGDPNGARGGRAAPGPDVGQWTSIAHDPANGLTHIAYYAATDGTRATGDLRYARRGAEGAWTTLTIDEAGDTGLYTSLALASDGAPIVSYFQRTGANGSLLKTAVKVARAKSKTPGPTDWTVTTVATGDRVPPPCSTSTREACADNEVCTRDGVAGSTGTCRVKARPAQCSPGCGSGAACAVDTGSAFACFEVVPGSGTVTLPDGDGLFTAIAYVDSKPLVVWYDRTARVLKGALADSDGPTGARFPDASVLDDGGLSGARHDVGRFAGLAVGPASAGRRIAVVYLDATANTLKLYRANADLSDPVRAVVDAGLGTPDRDPLLNVGADASIAFDSRGALTIAYQDATRGDLRLARQRSGADDFEVRTLAEDGAGGFYVSLVLDGDRALVSHAILQARSRTESANRLQILRAE
jgi:hypothetical protein